ncbi:MAG TPA: acetoin dehydrogenase dihydrolipoyllysine-residue acetyltransferase subunit [Ktedonobacteraceae bacterium]|nr:acetoin dehydrogenase dihydrolipoyllysine-residue acetyltransferase subunit [Ktedonobacteraceae bacterium]
MATILNMPKWGLSMKTGLIVEWLKKTGEAVQEGEPIVEIESEKATNEVEAPVTGIIRTIEIQEGDSAPVGAAIAMITLPGEELSDEQVAELLREDAEIKRQRAEKLAKPSAPKAATAGTAPRVVRAPASAGGRVNASPAARQLAQELGVDLTALVGTGPGGMIGREDVQRAAEEAKAASSEEAEEKVVDVGGVAIHYLAAGPAGAPRVVFVHGLGGSYETWSLNLPAFAEQFRICALDLPGAGSSDKPDMDYSIPAMADFLTRFLDALGEDWQRVNLVGHSLGGAIALAFASSYPKRVERLVLMDSAGLGAEINGEVLDLIRAEPTVEGIRTELTHFFAHQGLVQQALVEQLYQQRLQPGAREALLATMDAAFGGNQQHIDLRETLAALNGKALLVWGSEDSVIPVAHAREASNAPGSRVDVFEACGHCPHIERAEAFNQLATTFLS